jgi:uncharacterized alpha-E superfamily protein
MLLSRLAENLYWAGRYLERAEGTARLLKVHTELYLDLPLAAGLGWSPLLAVTGTLDEFTQRYGVASEDNVISFLAVDPENAGSIVASVCAARAALRTTRTIVPRATWEIANRLCLWVSDHQHEAVERRSRLRWMDLVVAECHALVGAESGTMTHDEAYSFLEIGRRLERADMTTRVLDVQAGILVGVATPVHPYADVTWMSVLDSLAARQMFRRSGHGGAPGPQALRFLLKHPQFPRSVERCLTEVSRALMELPDYEAPMEACATAQRALEDTDVAALADVGLHEFVDDLQERIFALHDRLTAVYFRNTVSPTDMLAIA